MDTCSLHPCQTFYSYFMLIFQILLNLASSCHLVKLCRPHLVFRKQVVDQYRVNHFQNFDSLKEAEAQTLEASSMAGGRDKNQDAQMLEEEEDKETYEGVACDEASLALVDTCKEDNKEVSDRDQVYSGCLIGCYPLWDSFACHFRKFLFLFIFYRSYSFTSTFIYRVNYRCGDVCLICDSICGFSSLVRVSSHFTSGRDCVLLFSIRYLSVSIDGRLVAHVGGVLGGEVLVR